MSNTTLKSKDLKVKGILLQSVLLEYRNYYYATAKRAKQDQMMTQYYRNRYIAEILSNNLSILTDFQPYSEYVKGDTQLIAKTFIYSMHPTNHYESDYNMFHNLCCAVKKLIQTPEGRLHVGILRELIKSLNLLQKISHFHR